MSPVSFFLEIFPKDNIEKTLRFFSLSTLCDKLRDENDKDQIYRNSDKVQSFNELDQQYFSNDSNSNLEEDTHKHSKTSSKNDCKVQTHLQKYQPQVTPNKPTHFSHYASASQNDFCEQSTSKEYLFINCSSGPNGNLLKEQDMCQLSDNIEMLREQLQKAIKQQQMLKDQNLRLKLQKERIAANTSKNETFGLAPLKIEYQKLKRDIQKLQKEKQLLLMNKKIKEKVIEKQDVQISVKKSQKDFDSIPINFHNLLNKHSLILNTTNVNSQSTKRILSKNTESINKYLKSSINLKQQEFSNIPQKQTSSKDDASKNIIKDEAIKQKGDKVKYSTESLKSNCQRFAFLKSFNNKKSLKNVSKHRNANNILVEKMNKTFEANDIVENSDRPSKR